MFLLFNCGIVPPLQAVLRFWSGREWDDVMFDEASGMLLQAGAATATAPASRPIVLSYPSSRHGRRFAVLVAVMVMCQELLRTRTTKTLRDVYYMDVAFYRTQDTVDRAARDLSSLLQVPRSALGLVASSKGWVAGELRFRHRGVLVDARTQVVPVPQLLADLDPSPSSAAEFILVVEKDAVFQQLVGDGFAFRYPCIMLTVC
jgi:DNA topoisomerase VI subunit A